MKLQFAKMHGLGNDFIMVDGTKHELPNRDYLMELAKSLCHRNLGIGADGLIVLSQSEQADYRMSIFNSDGTEAEMCGNGLRCAAVYAKAMGLCDKDEQTVETKAGLRYPTLLADGEVRVNMGQPSFAPADLPCTLEGEDNKLISVALPYKKAEVVFTGVNMGNPHCVIFIADDLNSFPIEKYGPEIETLPEFPEKTNVEFVTNLDRHNILMRVWERGCGETMACGTGACAAAVAAIVNDMADDYVNVYLRGGKLKIEYKEGGNVYMTGPTAIVYTGQTQIDFDETPAAAEPSQTEPAAEKTEQAASQDVVEPLLADDQIKQALKDAIKRVLSEEEAAAGADKDGAQ